MSFNLAVVLRESRKAHPDKPLCHIADQTFSYAQVDEISGRIAASLRNLGVCRGDKVAVQLPNLPHFLFAYFGILKAGAVTVPLDPGLRAPEIRHHLKDSDSRLLITFETVADEAVKGAAKIAGLSTYVLTLSGNGQRPVGTKSFDELYLADDTDDIEPTDADDTAVITYTSGVTRKPKRAELTHRQLYLECTVNGQRFRFGADDVSMAVLPMFHVFGLSRVLNVAVRFGGALVLVPPFDAQTVVDELARHRCSIFPGVPTMYRALLEADTDGRDLSALRVGCSVSAAIPDEVISAFQERFPGVVILEGHGLSQTPSTPKVKVREHLVPSVRKLVQRVAVRLVELPPGADDVERTTGFCVFAALLLLVIDVTPWREAKYFTGQLDGVVLGKIGLLITVVLIVLWAKRTVARSGRSINTVMAPAFLVLALYCGTSVLGAFLFGSLKSSAQLSVRVLVVGFVVLTLIELAGPMIVISTLSRVLAAVSIWIGATGDMDTAVFPHRLVGSIPPTYPNEIALMAAVPFIYFLWRTVNIDTSFRRLLAMIILGVVILLTNSRTSAALLAGVVVYLVIRGTRHGRFRLSMTTGAVLCLLFALTFTNAIQYFGTRGGTSPIESAGARVIAWNAVLNMDLTPMQTLLGQGLAAKLIPVAGQYWSVQIMDSSWFSAFVQAGLIGVVLAIALVIYVATQALRNVRPANDLWLSLLAFVVVRSIFESGLLDTSTCFVIFMVVSIGAATQVHVEIFSGGNHFHARV
jgi:long-chain acyl-CoA synthetase